jgi:hypothetical protein
MESVFSKGWRRFGVATLCGIHRRGPDAGLSSLAGKSDRQDRFRGFYSRMHHPEKEDWQLVGLTFS